MADVKFRATTLALNTSTGTQNITISGFGTPSSVIFLWGGTTDGAQRTDGAHFGMGFADGTSEYMSAVASEDNVTTSDTFRLSRNDRCINIYSVTSGSSEYVISWNSWLTDGVQINIAATTGVTRHVTAILIGGSDVSNAYVGNHKLTTTTGANDITSVGFEPDLVFFMGTGHGGYGVSGGSENIFSMGIAHNDGVDTQRCLLFSDKDGSATTAVQTMLRNDSCIGQIYNGSVTWRGSVGTFDSSGFTITIDSGNSASDYIDFLALKFTNSPDISIDSLDSPTSTGTYSTTAPGFEPDFAFLMLSDCTAENTLQNQEGFGVSVFDSTNEYCLAYSSEHNVGTSNAASQWHSNAVDDLTGGTTSLNIGTFSSFDTNGFSLSFPSTVAGTARKWAALTIGPATATGAYTLTADSGSYTYTGTTTGLNKGSKVQADSGSYALTGTATGLKRGVKLPANSGSYSLTGQTVGLLKGYKLPADSGSYTLTGQDVTLTYNPASSTYTLTCDSGRYTLTGVSQAFLRTYVLDMESGAYTLTGSNVTLSYSSGIWEVQSNNSDTWTVQ